MRKLEKTCLKAWHLNSEHFDLISKMPDDLGGDMLRWHSHVSDFLQHRQQVAEMHVRKAHLSERWSKKRASEWGDFEDDMVGPHHDSDDDDDDDDDHAQEKYEKASSSTDSRQRGIHMQVLASKSQEL